MLYDRNRFECLRQSLPTIAPPSLETTPRTGRWLFLLEIFNPLRTKGLRSIFIARQNIHENCHLIHLGRLVKSRLVVINGESWWKMALTGTYLRTLDEKKRIPVPKRIRDDFCQAELSSLIVAPGTERSLVYSASGFEQFAAKLKTDGNHQKYLRLFYSAAERVDVDGQGRIRIPDRLTEYAGLKRDTYLLGVHDHAELWDKDAWERFMAEHTPVFDELALRALGA